MNGVLLHKQQLVRTVNEGRDLSKLGDFRYTETKRKKSGPQSGPFLTFTSLGYFVISWACRAGGEKMMLQTCSQQNMHTA